ncbi:MAG: RNA polymerase sigma factor, partial [Anaerolineae bacterium]
MPDHVREDIALVRAAVEGDANAFGQLYLLHLDAIYRYIRFRVGNAADAEDLTEQVFLKAWEAIASYRMRGMSFSSWLYRIAHNLVMDHHRQNAPEVVVPLQSENTPSSDGRGTVEQVIESGELAAVAAAISHLSEEQQQVAVLRFIEGLSHAEVSRIIDKSLGACRVIEAGIRLANALY